MSGAGYDFGCSTYHPSGRVFQPEYAEKAVLRDELSEMDRSIHFRGFESQIKKKKTMKGARMRCDVVTYDVHSTVVGIRCQDGVVIGVQKSIEQKMLVSSSYHRVFLTSKQSGMAVAGVIPDGRQLVNKAREESSEYKRNFGISIPGKVLSQRLAMFMHAYTEYWHLRPFGNSILMAVYDETEGYQLYMIDPTGECNQYFGIAAGKSHQAARVELEKLDFEVLKCRDAALKIAEIIYSNWDDAKDKPFELELGWVSDESKNQFEFVPSELLEAAIAAGKRAQEEEDESSDDDAAPAAGN